MFLLLVRPQGSKTIGPRLVSVKSRKPRNPTGITSSEEVDRSRLTVECSSQREERRERSFVALRLNVVRGLVGSSNTFTSAEGGV